MLVKTKKRAARSKFKKRKPLDLGQVTDVVIDEDELESSLCRESFFDFVQSFWATIIPEKPVWNWHIRYLCNVMQRIAENLFLGNDKLYDLCVNVPPGTSKSSVLSVLFPAWVWTRMPTARFICVSFRYPLALRLSSKSRDVVKSEKYRRLFPEIALRSDQDTKHHFTNTLGGERYCAGSGGSVIGSHAHFVIVDDPIDPDSVVSDAELEAVNLWIEETLSGRKVDKAKSVTVLVMQRLHMCLLPDTKIRTPLGETAIQDLTCGDVLYTSAGRQRVKAVSTRDWKGDVVGIRPYGHPTMCWTTPGHKVYTQRGWVRADSVSHKDWVFLPAAPSDKTAKWEPPVVKPGGGFTGNFNGDRMAKGGEYKEKLKALATSGMTNIEIAAALGVHRNTVACHLRYYRLGRVADRTLVSGDSHLTDPGFWRLVGYWLAEGSFVTGRGKAPVGVNLAFASREIEYVADVVSLIEKFGMGGCAVVTKKEVHSTRVTNCCSQLARWLKRHFGAGSHGKRLPEFVFSLPAACLEQLRHGWMLGDGNAYRSGSNVTSVSHRLLHDFQRVSILLGQPGYLTWYDKGTRAFKIGRYAGVSSGRQGHLRYGQGTGKRPNAVVVEGGCWFRVRRVSRKRYNGPVLDVTTDAGDFVVGNMVVHNSDPAARMLKSGGVKHVCLPACLEYAGKKTEVKPLSLVKYYKDGLLDPIRLQRKVLDALARKPRGAYLVSGQYLQNPVPPGGGQFKTDLLMRLTHGESQMFLDPARAKKNLRAVTRFWDKAITEGGGAYTVGVKMGISKSDRVVILDVIRFQHDSWRRERIIKETAKRDGRHCVVGLEQEPGSGGKESNQNTARRLMGYRVKTLKPTTSKTGETRADAFSQQVNAGNVLLCKGAWNAEYVEELRHFPHSTYKDQVDASSGAFTVTWSTRRVVGGLGCATRGGRSSIEQRGQSESTTISGKKKGRKIPQI